MLGYVPERPAPTKDVGARQQQIVAWLQLAMKIDYSPAVEIALHRAVVQASMAGASQIGPMDMLRGLLEEEEGQAVALVLAAGVEMAKLRALFPPLPGSGAEAGDLPLAPAATQILAYARELARWHAA